MRFSRVAFITVMLVVVAVAFAGCTGSTPAAPSGGNTPASAPTASGASDSRGTAPAGADLFGTMDYNWVEYKTTMGSGNEAMTAYYKYNKQTGKCSMRIEGPGMEDIPAGMLDDIDCGGSGATGQASSSDPNDIPSDATVDCSLLDESVTVPAGTFSATKCTVTSQGTTSSMWVAKGKFMVKMVADTGEGSVDMVLNAYG